MVTPFISLRMTVAPEAISGCVFWVWVVHDNLKAYDLFSFVNSASTIRIDVVPFRLGLNGSMHVTIVQNKRISIRGFLVFLVIPLLKCNPVTLFGNLCKKEGKISIN